MQLPMLLKNEKPKVWSVLFVCGRRSVWLGHAYLIGM